MKITKHCTEIEGDYKCGPRVGLDIARSNVNNKVWAAGWWNRTDVVNGCGGNTAALMVLSKVSRLIRCLVQPSNCSPLCRCSGSPWCTEPFWNSTRCQCKPCVPDETRGLLILGKHLVRALKLHTKQKLYFYWLERHQDGFRNKKMSPAPTSS